MSVWVTEEVRPKMMKNSLGRWVRVNHTYHFP